MFRKLSIGVCSFLVTMFLLVTSSYAALDLTGVAVDVTSVLALATVVLIALAAIWPIRKAIKTLNRS